MSSLDEIESKLERQHIRKRSDDGDNQRDSHLENHETLMRSFVAQADVPTNDDVVCIKRDCNVEKYLWLKPYIGLVVKVREPGSHAPPEVQALPFQPDFKFEEQTETFCVVEFNLFHANTSSSSTEQQQQLPTQQQQQQVPPPQAALVFDKMAIPSGVLHAAVPASVLQVLDRGISALETVVHIRSARIGSVGGYRLIADAMPIEFPKNAATSSFVSDEKQIEVLQRAGLLPQLGPTSSPESNLYEHPILEKKVFKLHCTDLMPANPYRRTVAVVHKTTLQVGFVDEAVMNAIILLDNGAICLVEDVDSLEKALTRPPKKVAINIKRRQQQQKQEQQHENKQHLEQDGAGDSDEKSHEKAHSRHGAGHLAEMLREFGVEVPPALAKGQHSHNDKKKKSNKKNNTAANKNNKKQHQYQDEDDENERDDDEEGDVDGDGEEAEDEEEEEYDYYNGDDSTDVPLVQKADAGMTMDDIGKPITNNHDNDNNSKKKTKKNKNTSGTRKPSSTTFSGSAAAEVVSAMSSKDNSNNSNIVVNNNNNNKNATSGSMTSINDDDANPARQHSSFSLSEVLSPPAQSSFANIREYNDEGFAPFDDDEDENGDDEEENDDGGKKVDDGDGDDDDDDGESEEYMVGQLAAKWEEIDEQLLDDGIWPPPYASFVERAPTCSAHHKNVPSSTAATSTTTTEAVVEGAGGESNTTAKYDMNDYDPAIGKVHGLPLWAKTKPTLGWFRKVIVPHYLVRDKEILMALGQPDYQKNRERGYDVGTIICLSSDKVYVKWTIPHMDPNTDAPPPVVEECSANDLFILQNFYHELLGVDYLHDVAFLRTPPPPHAATATSKGGDEMDNSTNNGDGDGDDDDDNNFDFSHGTIQDRQAERERARQEYIQVYVKAMNLESDPPQQQQSQHHHQNQRKMLPYYNFEEVETSVSGLSAFEVNKFYSLFRFPEPVADAERKLSGRHALPNLLYDAKWQTFFKRLSPILSNAVRIVDIESQCCVTWSNGETSPVVPARDLCRPDVHPGSLFEHLTAVPRDIVYRPQELVDFHAHQQQKSNDNVASPSAATTTISASPHSASPHSASEHFCRVDSARPTKFETCALFDIARCAYPDIDCVVSDVVTLRTKDEQAQIAAVAGPPPRELGQVLSIDPIEMTAEVAWKTFCDWDKLLSMTQRTTTETSGAGSGDGGGVLGVNHHHQLPYTSSSSSSSSSFTISLTKYPLISTASARVAAFAAARNEAASSATSASPLSDEDVKEETFARYFDETNNNHNNHNNSSSNISKDKRRVLTSSSSSSSTSPFVYHPSFMVGQIMGKISFDSVIVKWWDGSMEILPPHRLVVHHFPYDDEEELGEDEEEMEEEDEEELAEEDEDDEEENQGASGEEKEGEEDQAPDAPQTPPSSPFTSATTPTTTTTTTSTTMVGSTVSSVAQDQQQQNNENEKSGVVNTILSTAARSVGNFLAGVLANAVATPTSTTTTTTAMTTNQKQLHVDPMSPSTDQRTSHDRDTREHDANENDDHAEQQQDTTDSSSPLLLPLTSTPGTFQPCSRFVSHLIDTDLALSFNPSQPTIFTRRLLHEMKSLRTNPMPDIFVKTNDERSHTFKFAIAGAVHTPYYGGLYCFDLALPANFPNQPPTVKFHARNMRLNPNLYEDGHVCLSLLGTWNGEHQCEQWSPSSTLRQVLLSIQAIILCQEPYYNEAGFDAIRGTPEGQAHSRMYNEHTFLLKVSHLMHYASQHPPDWGFEFREHYKRQVPRLLQRMRTYLQLFEGGENHLKKSVVSGSINADGLVAPMSSGLRTALTSRIEALQRQFDVLVPKWNAELAEFEAAFVGGDEDDDVK